MRFRARRSSSPVPALILALSLAGCSVGLDYFPEAAPTPTKYKELKGWKFATPRDWADRGDWWSLYRDPKLAFLLKQVEISNQTVAAAAASYEQARALIRQAQAALFPTVSASYTYTRTRTGPAAFGAQSSTGAFGAGFTAAPSTRRPSCRSSPAPGTSTSGAKCAGRSRAIRLPRKPAPPISTMPSFRRRGRSPPPISISAPRMRCANCSCAQSKEYKTTLEIVQRPVQQRVCGIEGGCRDGRGPGFRHRGASHQRRRAARAIRARHRDADRPPACRTHDCDAPAGRTHSENPGLGPFDTARAAPGHRRGGADDAGAKRADRRRHSRLFPGHFALRPAAMGRQKPVAVSCRQRGVVAGRGRRASAVQRRVDLRPGRRRARRLLAKRRQLSSDRAHGVPAGGGSARRGPHPSAGARGAAAGGEGRSAPPSTSY